MNNIEKNNLSFSIKVAAIVFMLLMNIYYLGTWLYAMLMSTNNIGAFTINFNSYNLYYFEVFALLLTMFLNIIFMVCFVFFVINKIKNIGYDNIKNELFELQKLLKNETDRENKNHIMEKINSLIK